MSHRFQGKEFTFTQPDGTAIQVRGWGDQHHARFETLDGYTVVLDPNTGFYQLAQLSGDGAELEPTGARCDMFQGKALGLAKNVRITRESAKAKGREMFQTMMGGRRCEKRRAQRQSAIRAAIAADSPQLAPPARQTIGNFVGLCILIDFPDVHGVIPSEDVTDFCNKQGYDGFGNNGSVRDYFLENSLGRIDYTNIVTGYYRANHPKSFYTNPNVPFGTRARQLIREALDQLTADGFDFSQLTTDDDGYVYALNIYYAGNVVNNWSQGLWPHSWSLGAEYNLGGGRIAFDYQFTAIGDELELGTFCHENGHMVCDYPDLYDYGNESNGVGVYCLMCAGGSDQKNPTHICAYLKNASGWSGEVTPITTGVEPTLTAGENQFAIYIKNQHEYFIIENRQATGRDASLPSAGLAIWHVDEQATNDDEQMTPSRHYEVSLEQADNQFDLERDQNNGDPNDLFQAPDADAFSDTTAPDSLWWDGTPSELKIHSISASGPTMTFKAGDVVIDEDDTTTPGTIVESSAPGLDIPDANAIGVTDTITITETAAISSIKVNVDITHTYRGDLRVTLLSPAGTEIVLHQRHQGGSDDDLKRSYDFGDTPALRTLQGQGTQGPWTLRVQDLAFWDSGTLNEWGLEIQTAAETIVELEETPGTKIPDNDPAGIERTLLAQASGEVKNLSIDVDITHTYIHDLVVTLRSPAGTSVDLHHKSGGSADNIVKTFTLDTTPDLGEITGQPAGGEWKLLVSDHVGLDKGKLNRWHLKIVQEI